MDTDERKLYNGYNLAIDKLEKSPETILQVSKCFLKEKIYEIHNNIKEFKSSYPYKYSYVMATTIEPDEEYELMVLNMQKKIIKTMEKKT